jgi:hypothetical protein
MSDERYRLLWSLALLAAIVSLYFGHAPSMLLGALLTLFPMDPRSPRNRGG